MAAQQQQAIVEYREQLDRLFEVNARIELQVILQAFIQGAPRVET